MKILESRISENKFWGLNISDFSLFTILINFFIYYINKFSKKEL